MFRKPHVTPGTPEEQIKQILSFLIQLVDDLEYELNLIKSKGEK